MKKERKKNKKKRVLEIKTVVVISINRIRKKEGKKKEHQQ